MTRKEFRHELLLRALAPEMVNGDSHKDVARFALLSVDRAMARLEQLDPQLFDHESAGRYRAYNGGE